MLVVYGNYGLKPLFPLQRLYHPLLRRGIGLGVAHVRGGGEYGPQGWKSARGNNKEVSATDLIALSRSLHPTPIVIRAQSAGGLVALRALSATPELFRGAVLIAPVLDHGRSLSDPRIAGQQENDRFE
jgi:protease II